MNKIASQPSSKEVKKAPRILRSFVKARAVRDTEKLPIGSGCSIPGMTLYDEHDAGIEVGTENFPEADQESIALSKRCEFFELSPQ